MASAELFGIPVPKDGIFTRYHAEIQFRNRIMGGIPGDESTMKAWLATKLELDQPVLEQKLAEILAKRTADAESPDATDVDSFNAESILEEAAAGHIVPNGFLRVDGDLVYEGRCLKAGIKEAANVAFPGKSWPDKPAEIRKGLMRYLAERVFVDDDYISLGVQQPSGVHESVKHLSTPQGPKSALGCAEYVDKAHVEATVSVLGDCISPRVWHAIWTCLEEIGLGADRSVSYGRFDLVAWDRLK